MCAKEVRGGGASASGVHGGPSPSLAEAFAAVYGLRKNSLNMSVPSGFMHSCAIFISPGKYQDTYIKQRVQTQTWTQNILSQ